jgi:phosphonate transport system substrate-binding protein
MKSFKFIYCSLILTSLIFANDCNRGSLSSKFCDRDNDMLADTPTDTKELVDPHTLVFGNVPSQSFIFDKDAKKALMQHIEKYTGKKVVFFPYQTNLAELEAMRSGMLHIAGMNTGSVPMAVNCAGFKLFAMTALADKSYGYTMKIITYKGSKINSPKDIKGQTILFTSSSSNSGYKAPVAILNSKFNLEEGVDYKSKFSGSHAKSIVKVANKEYKVAAVASGFTPALIRNKKIAKDSIKVIYESDSFPTTGYGYSNKLKPSLAKKIEEAFFTFEFKDKNKASLKPFNKFGESRFIPVDYKKNWSIIREIDKVNKINYDCH